MTPYRMFFIILTLVVLFGIDVCHATEKEAKTIDIPRISEVLDTSTTEGPAESHTIIELEEFVPPPTQEMVLSILSIANDDDFEAKLAEMLANYQVNEKIIREWRREIAENGKSVKAEYDKCAKGNNTGLLKLASASKDILLNYQICKKLEQGSAACEIFNNNYSDMRDMCANADLEMMFLLQILPAAKARNQMESDFGNESKRICLLVPQKDRPKDCEDMLSNMLKTINTALFAKDVKDCDNLKPVKYEQYCRALFSKNVLFCETADNKDFNLCFDNFFLNLLAVMEKDSGLAEIAKANNDVRTLLTAWHITPKACEYYVGSESDNSCNIFRMIAIGNNSRKLTEQVKQMFLPEEIR